MEHKDSHAKHVHHHILPTGVALTVGGSLLCLTGLTVWVAGFDLGKLNFFVAMVIATIKALLVMLFFMGLLYDRLENALIFSTSFLFLGIFITLTGMDLFFRCDVYVHGPIMAAQAEGHSKLKKPWISTPELIAHGKELFMVQCVACHGPKGDGTGPAAAALNPHPRNFTQAADWVNGRRHTMVFKTLKEGVAGSGMASFATLPADDRWALDSYVLSLGPQPVPEDSAADFAKIGIDPNKEGGGATEAPTVPVEFEMQKLAQADIPARPGAHALDPNAPGSGLYRENCASCHGMAGQGGIKVKSLAITMSPAFVETQPFRASNAELASEAAFAKLVEDGIPGNLMPGFGQLSGAELHALYDAVRGLAK